MWNLLRIKKISKSAKEMKVTERNVAHIKLQFASHLEHIPSALYCTFRQCWIWKLFLFKSICQPKKALSIIQSATSIKLLHVPAPWSHSQEVWAQRNISLTWHTHHILHLDEIPSDHETDVWFETFHTVHSCTQSLLFIQTKFTHYTVQKKPIVFEQVTHWSSGPSGRAV